MNACTYIITKKYSTKYTYLHIHGETSTFPYYSVSKYMKYRTTTTLAPFLWTKYLQKRFYPTVSCLYFKLFFADAKQQAMFHISQKCYKGKRSLILTNVHVKSLNALMICNLNRIFTRFEILVPFSIFISAMTQQTPDVILQIPICSNLVCTPPIAMHVGQNISDRYLTQAVITRRHYSEKRSPLN